MNIVADTLPIYFSCWTGASVSGVQKAGTSTPENIYIHLCVNERVIKEDVTIKAKV